MAVYSGCLLRYLQNTTEGEKVKYRIPFCLSRILCMIVMEATLSFLLLERGTNAVKQDMTVET